MARRSTVTPFSRDYRRPPRWGMGLPPRRPRRRRARVWLGMVVVLAVLLVPRAGDAVNAGLTRTDGCRIWGLVDGDTVRMYCPGSGWQATRLTGYDTPEFRGDCGRERVMAWLATQALRWHLWRAGEIAVAERGRDRFDRRLAWVRVDGVPLAGRMVETGLARPYAGGPRPGWCG
jgi:endonuclease YncB( thermonuclease family)